MAKTKLEDINCAYCWKTFHPKNRYTKFCCKDCVSKSLSLPNQICPTCWKTFHPVKSGIIYCCNDCYLQAHKRKDIECKYCWKTFFPNYTWQEYCSRECQRASLRKLPDIECEECWKKFRPKNRYTKYCSRECQYIAKSKWNKIRRQWLSEEEKQKQIAPLFDYNNLNNISKINLKYKESIEWVWLDVELEKQLWRWTYDLCVWNTLIDINPFAYHNTTRHPYDKPRDKSYHYEKLKLANQHGYRCIMVRDRDKMNDIINLIREDKISIWARECIVKQILYEDCDSFFEDNHLQWNTRKDKNNIYIWLYYGGKLVECMSFWKPRQNKNYEWEILRLCSHKDYRIVWWANKMFKFFLEIANTNSVISYCDMSKFDWKVYEQLWFKLLKWNKPSKHWYNPKLKQHITDWLVRQYWYDKLFKTNYWKWFSNDELMRQSWYVEIYDCWQATFVYNK